MIPLERMFIVVVFVLSGMDLDDDIKPPKAKKARKSLVLQETNDLKLQVRILRSFISVFLALV